jgi:transposase
MFTVGIDVHSKRSNLCVLDDHGKIVREQVVNGSPRRLVEHLRTLPAPFKVCYEASTSSGWLFDQLRSCAASVSVAHPGLLRLIFRSKKKNDRIDAAKLAKLEFLGEVPGAYTPSAQVRSWRAMIVHRHSLVHSRTAVKNNIRVLLRSQAVEPPRGMGLWTKKGLAWLRTVCFLTRADDLRRDLLLIELDQADQMVKKITAELDRIAADHPGVALFRTIPGIGPRTAESFIAYVDNPQRFRTSKCIGAYLGLVPSQDQSGSKNRLGRITKQGPPVVRSMLVEAAWRGIRCSASLKAYFDRITREDPDRRRIALIATAHHLARVMLSMLKSGTPWEERLSRPHVQPGGEMRPLSPPEPTPLPPSKFSAEPASRPTRLATPRTTESRSTRRTPKI